MIEITNKSKRPLSVPLPGGKKLFLAPGAKGQISDRALQHPPLDLLVQEGHLEVGEGRGQTGESVGPKAPTATTKAGGAGRSYASRKV